MKLILITATLMFTQAAWTTNGDTLLCKCEPSETKDAIKEITVKEHEGKLYFNLRVINESQSGWYSLVKYLPNGDKESVMIKEGVKNELDTPILYSFIDEDPDRKVEYKLIRIRSTESLILASWSYDPAVSQTVLQSCACD